MSLNESHSKISYEITKELSSKVKKEQGIYFTSRETIELNIELIKEYIPNIKTVLEPSCGSGEFIIKLNELYPHLKITGIEQNKIIYDKIRPTIHKDTQIINGDYIINTLPTYDLIITNPPYVVLKQNKTLNTYKQYYDGRPNLFILFIIKSLSLLNKNGILSFILPKNFLNCLYYDKTRKYINENYTILHIVECKNDYIDTTQGTILLIIQNVVTVPMTNMPNPNNKFILNTSNGATIFGIPENIIKIRPLIDNTTTLNKLGFVVNVGNIVWNQCKDILTDESNTRLIYSSDITNNKLAYKTYTNIAKKNYIIKDGITDPLLVINRGYGKGKYKFNYCLIDIDTPYLIENHLICIKYKNKISKNKLLELYETIIKSLCDKRTAQFIELYFTNNAINTTELSNILPIYI